MMAASADAIQRPVLIVAPIEGDAETIGQVLGRGGFRCGRSRR
jgi:hypothetical protein